MMGHIPPGIDPFTTILKMRNVCGGKPPDEFLASDELGKTIGDFGDVVLLAIFAHTHMDELRLLKPSGSCLLYTSWRNATMAQSHAKRLNSRRKP